VAAAMIATREDEWFRSEGTDQSAGSKLLSVSGDCEHPGVYEYPFGTPIRQILEECGAHDTQAVQLSGAAGRLLSPAHFDHTVAFEDMATGGSFMIFDDSRDLLEVVRNFAAFFAHESCGFCTPCRVGTTLIRKGLEKIDAGRGSNWDLENLRRIGGLMRNTSQCGLGATAPSAMFDLLDHFDVAQQRLHSPRFEPAFDLDAALEEARQASGRTDQDLARESN
jgi:[NiFe] hydrogenase diaphorase moiety large subunit